MPGLWFSEFEEGQVFDHEWTRTLTESDNTWFSLLTMNPQPLHIDHHKAAQSEFGKPLVNSLFSLGLLVGMTVNDTTLNTTVANLGMEKVRFPAPLFHGDTVRARTTVIGIRPSKSRPGQGIVTFLHELFKQDDTLVASCERAALMKAKPSED
jgi:acyl dehydratase